ncbi:hypothetical protein IEQ34_004494 [Dendrobium chrysotoxum]|uniref:Uncharacterized protein n=1 Tax=Dendrobium chrysotoxum TaxID=161865 RepID=A0AAV7HFC4_DENCH|nr:hypothetical protein IEQ34_004494 [Dendrobium chrysotoxum]
MEASMRSKLITAVLVAIVAASSLVEQAAAADAPAPSPTSGAVTTSPALSLVEAISRKEEDSCIQGSRETARSEFIADKLAAHRDRQK